MSLHLPTGEQFRLSVPGPPPVSATITELGATLRSLRVDGRPLVQEYDEAVVPPGAAGVVLVPWPNRVAGATWPLDGNPQLLDVTEPSTGNASHGLLRNTGYAVAEMSEASVTLTASVFPQHGYPFLLATTVRYELEADGVKVTHTITHTGAASSGPAPVALGAHPYLCTGVTDRDVRELAVTVRAQSYFETDDTGIPVGEKPVGGTPYDLNSGPVLGERHLDTAYSGLTLDDGKFRHRVLGPDGTGAELWADPDFAFVQVFTNRKWPTGSGTALAVEPMTAPANALNTGIGLRWLEMGETWALSWGLRAHSR